MADHLHNHAHDCAPMSPRKRAAALSQAGDIAVDKGLSFTPQRQAVFELLLEAGRPVGAYTLMDELSKRQSRTIAPPTIYRALDFLQQIGVVSRLESSNEFIPCKHPAEPHDCIFLICTCCRKAVEMAQEDVHASLAALAKQHGFKTGRQVIELQGLCSDCS
ncbi:MAG: Fur family transcriptional regulator [Pseudomonadota bacterium]